MQTQNIRKSFVPQGELQEQEFKVAIQEYFLAILVTPQKQATFFPVKWDCQTDKGGKEMRENTKHRIERESSSYRKAPNSRGTHKEKTELVRRTVNLTHLSLSPFSLMYFSVSLSLVFILQTSPIFFQSFIHDVCIRSQA